MSLDEMIPLNNCCYNGLAISVVLSLFNGKHILNFDDWSREIIISFEFKIGHIMSFWYRSFIQASCEID